jgi:hypothetical protein
MHTDLKRFLTLTATMITLGGGFACVPTDDQACTDIAIASATVTVTDDAGAPIADATVEWSVDGVTWAACDEGGAAGAYRCGWEQAGELRIRASAAGYVAGEGDVSVPMDDQNCHVVGQSLTLTLAADVDCTAELRPSVIATVAGASGEALTGVAVTWLRDGGEPAPCVDQGEAGWWCADELAGRFVIAASADGHGPASVTIDVGEDECHVITEAVTLTLDWLPD